MDDHTGGPAPWVAIESRPGAVTVHRHQMVDLMTMRSLLISAALAGALLGATGLSAQTHPTNVGDSRPTGLILGLNATGSFVTVSGATLQEHTFAGRGREGGGGMNFTVGYAFTPAIGVLLHGGAVVLNEEQEQERVLGGVELAVRHSFATTSRSLVPYMEMALGGFALEDGVEGGGSEFAGGSLSVAAGFNYFVTRRFALNADFRYNMGMFSTVSVNSRTITDDARMGFGSSRVNVGINWYPMAR